MPVESDVQIKLGRRGDATRKRHVSRLVALGKLHEIRAAETEQSSNDDPRVLASELPQQSAQAQ